MATPKEQHDARPNARTIGHVHSRTRPADATPPGGVPAVSLRGLLDELPLVAVRVGQQVASEEPAERA